MSSTATNSFGYFLATLSARQRGAQGGQRDPAAVILRACKEAHGFVELQRVAQLDLTTLLDQLGKLESAGLLVSRGEGEARQ
ncbi:MAG: hypothetical protein FJX68_08580 [Alphaproteobacteria bacterium]|nr:hypothetical protein [Alphaproteobacteria bacterium]